MKDHPQIALTVLNSLKEPLFVLDSSGRCVMANESLLLFLGLSGREGTVQISDFWPEASKVPPTQEEISQEFKLADGKAFFVKLQQFRLQDGHRVFRVVSGHSKTDPLQNFHNQRLETLGLLAGGIAHDFNNILTGILGHTTYLKTILPAAGSHKESLNAIEDGARKGSSITQQILNFSKLDSAEKACRIDLSDLVKKTCALLRRAISPEYSLEPKIPENSLCVLGIESQIAQVVVNLVINARDAIESDGAIKIELEAVSDRGKIHQVFGGLDVSSTTYARLTVADNGVGIPKEVQGRIFEPYFSTKKDKGTGLGLSTVYAIVKSLGGAIDLSSELGVGTSISVFLPMMEGVFSSEAPSSSRAAGLLVRGANERILVVDDEYPVRNVLCVSLEHLGYRVEVAASGAEAIERFSGSELGYDLVILDMLMPHMSGEQVFSRLRQIDSSVKVLLISGYSSEDSIQNVLKGGGKAFIQKPFTIEELSRQVRVCLEE